MRFIAGERTVGARDVEKWNSRNHGEEVLNGEIWEDESGDFTLFHRARDPFGRGGLRAEGHVPNRDEDSDGDFGENDGGERESLWGNDERDASAGL